MYKFSKMSIWENRKAIKSLQEFRRLIINYFEYDWIIEDGAKIIDGPKPKFDIREVRSQINKMQLKIEEIIEAAMLKSYIYYAPPPMIGGWAGELDLITNIFLFRKQGVEPQLLIDLIDKALGIFESNSRRALLRTINPLFWVDRIFIYIAAVPFKILSVFGKDPEIAEASKVGKIIKGFFYLIQIFAALLACLHYLDILK